MTDDWTVVVPGPGEVTRTAQVLLSLARDPGDLRTAAGGTEFRIPPYLADLYHAPPLPKRRRTKREEGDE